MESETLILIGAGSAIALVGVGVVWLILHSRKKEDKEDRHRLTTTLQSEQLKSDIIIGSIEDGVVLIDNKGVIQLFNPAATRISGWLNEDALKLDYKAVLKLVDEHDKAYADNLNPFTQAIEEVRTIRDNNATLVTKSDKRIPVSLIVSPLIDESSKNITGAVGVIRDVTNEKQEERQRGDFISTASHEMRTPIAAIEGYLTLAINDPASKVNKVAKTYLEKAHTATKHLGTLFQDLLTSSKAEDGRLTNHPKVIELGELLQRVTDEARFNAGNKGLALDYEIGPKTLVGKSNTVRPLFYVEADPDRIREVIQNFIDNAIKYTKQGRISVNITGDEQHAQIRVQDTGPGIAAEDLPHLFQKFYRVDNSMTRTVGGTGLGLFISRKIIEELYNGRVWVESTVGTGSSFYIKLPRLSSSKVAELQRRESEELKGRIINPSKPAGS